MKSEFIKLALSAAFVASLAACSPTAQSSLLTDQASDPTSHSMSTEPAETELFLKADTSNLGTTTATRIVELSGECFASTYPSHEIKATVQTGSSSGVPLAVYNVDAGKSVASCKNGRFNISVKASQLAVGTNVITLTLTAYDSSNVAYTNGNGMTVFSVIRSN